MKAKKAPVNRTDLNIENFVTGHVTSVNVKGVGPNSAQLLFVVEDKAGKGTPLVVTAYPDYEPQVFASISAFVSAAHFQGKVITAGYYARPGETSRVIEVFSPPLERSKKK